MKTKIILFFSFSVVCNGILFAQKNDPILMTVGASNVPLSEFEYLYNKNNAGDVVDKKTLSEYVQMFEIFKLKVEDAKTQGLDTTASFRTEFGQYRNQLAQQYLTDDASQKAVELQAYNNMKEDLDVSHILISLPLQATPADTLAAYKKALAALSALKNEPFDSVAKRFSDDKMVQQNGGHFGWLTAFSTIYPFEKAAYALKAGEISQPVRSQVGYHIIKVNARRPDEGEVQVAHIFKAFDKNNSERNLENEKLMDSIYNRLLAGDEFGKLANTYSDDRSTAQKGGELQPFHTGQMMPEFEQQAFALKNIGDISKHFTTSYGFHIIKLVDKKPLGTFDELKPQIERQLQRDERSQAGRNAFIANLKAKYKPVILTTNLANYYPFVNTDGTNYPLDTVFFKKTENFDKPILKLNGKTYTQADLNIYMKTYYMTQKRLPQDIIADKVNEFQGRKLLDLEDAQLETKYTDFRNLVREYHDGILLFDVSNSEIWERSQTDTTGLEQYFAQNKDKYVWDTPHYKGTVVYCRDLDTYQNAINISHENQQCEAELLALNNDSVRAIRLQQGLFAPGDNKEVDKLVFENIDNYEPDEQFPYSFLIGKELIVPEDYTDVRWQVSSDYQELLETNWVNRLRAQYPVKIDENVLKLVKEN
ncbi:MAG: peptidyl-prolyl cis-trans isomerase [Paludibacter sp.]|nr:peptidyl-prolyl cis-trans isomerase [Paludibacter sp.]